MIPTFALGVALGAAEFQIQDLKTEAAKQEMSIKYLDQKVDGHANTLGILTDRDKRNG
jgi:hypothetical protein